MQCYNRRMDAVIIFCAEYLAYFVALCAVACGALSPRVNRWEFAATLAVALPLAYGLARLAGLLYAHPQPFALEGYEPLIPHEINNAFPSDHAAVSAAFASLAWFYNRGLGIALWILAFFVGAGRVLAGLHYPFDVVVGFLLGGVAVAAAHYSVHFYFSRHKQY